MMFLPQGAAAAIAFGTVFVSIAFGYLLQRGERSLSLALPKVSAGREGAP